MTVHSTCSECASLGHHWIAPAREDGAPDRAPGVCKRATRLDPTRTRLLCGSCFEDVTGRPAPDASPQRSETA